MLVNRDIQMEWSYTDDGFQRMIKPLRIYMRCNLGIVNEKGASLVPLTNEFEGIYWPVYR